MSLRFDLRQLRYFIAVAEEGSFRKAAERLHLSQPPLSRQIRELESALNVSLFVRSAEGVMPSPAGAALLPRAVALLAEADALAAAVAGAQPATRSTMRLGVTLAVQPNVVARLERAWRRVVPDLTISFGHTPDLIARLRGNGLEFALIGLPGDTAGLHFEVVDTESLIAVVPQDHPAAAQPIVSLRDFDRLPLFWWQRSHNPQYFDHAQQVFRDIGYRPKLIYVEPGQFLTLERISRGEGITLLNASREVIPIAGLAYRQFEENSRLAIRIAVAWKPGGNDRLAEALAKAAARRLRTATRPKRGPVTGSSAAPWLPAQ